MVTWLMPDLKFLSGTRIGMPPDDVALRGDRHLRADHAVDEHVDVAARPDGGV